MVGQTPERVRLVCLVPARNCASELPRWLTCVRLFCDAVVALDDGSTDETAEVLGTDPLVRIVLANPVRSTSSGWHDGRNRNRLLAAAADLDPEWVLFLDTDEFLDAADAAALRAFVERDGLPGFAYGLQHFRIWLGSDGEDLYDPECRLVFRLFAFERGQRLPETRLHFHPVPTSIPVEHWLPTTIRLRHYSAATPALVAKRLQKYAEADPNGEYPVDFGGLHLAPTTPLPAWPARPRDLTVLGAAPAEADDLDASRPEISAVMIARNDAEVIGDRLAALVAQRADQPIQVVVVVSGSAETAAVVRHRYPEVELVELDEGVLPGAARNVGLARANGEIVTFPGSHIELRPGALESRRRAHLRGHAMVMPATLNGTDTPPGWASYFLDHSHALPARPSGELNGPPGNCSYDRRALLEIGGFPEDLRAGEDTAVNLELFRLGHSAWFEPEAVQVHFSPSRTTGALLRHHYRRGRGLAQLAARDGRPMLGVAWRESAPSRRRRLTAERVEAWGDDEIRLRYAAVRRLVWLGGCAYRVGLLTELLRPRLGTWLALSGRSHVVVVVAGVDRRAGGGPGRADALVLARLSLIDGTARVLSLPRDLLVSLPGHGAQKLNLAYAFGGPSLLATAVGARFGVTVDAVIAVDFGGFRRLVDRLGGIEVDVPRPLFDPLASEGQGLVSAEFRPGRQRIDGRKALAYARSRRVDGDEARRHRQLDIGTAIATQARALRSPARIALVACTAARALRVSASPSARLRLFWAALRLRPVRIRAQALEAPLIRMEYLPDGRYIQEADQTELVARVRQALVVG